MVTHPDINPVQQGLTLVNRREPVFPFGDSRTTDNNLITFSGPKMGYFYLPSSECALEYTGPVNELKDMCEIRIEVAGILRDCRVS